MEYDPTDGHMHEAHIQECFINYIPDAPSSETYQSAKCPLHSDPLSVASLVEGYLLTVCGWHSE